MTYNLKTSPSHLLHRAQQLAANESASALASAGITLRQFSVLAALSGNDGVSQSDLVNATGIDRSTLADMVARMEKAGLIKRVASKTDKRAKVVSLMSGLKDMVAEADKVEAPAPKPAAPAPAAKAAAKPAVKKAPARKPAAKKPAAKKAPAAKAAPKPAVKKAPAKKAAPKAKAKAAPKAKAATTTKPAKKAPARKARKSTKK